MHKKDNLKASSLLKIVLGIVWPAVVFHSILGFILIPLQTRTHLYFKTLFNTLNAKALLEFEVV